MSYTKFRTDWSVYSDSYSCFSPKNVVLTGVHDLRLRMKRFWIYAELLELHRTSSCDDCFLSLPYWNFRQPFEHQIERQHGWACVWGHAGLHHAVWCKICLLRIWYQSARFVISGLTSCIEKERNSVFTCHQPLRTMQILRESCH